MNQMLQFSLCILHPVCQLHVHSICILQLQCVIGAYYPREGVCETDRGTERSCLCPAWDSCRHDSLWLHLPVIREDHGRNKKKGRGGLWCFSRAPQVEELIKVPTLISGSPHRAPATLSHISVPSPLGEATRPLRTTGFVYGCWGDRHCDNNSSPKNGSSLNSLIGWREMLLFWELRLSLCSATARWSHQGGNLCILHRKQSCYLIASYFITQRAIRATAYTPITSQMAAIWDGQKCRERGVRWPPCGPMNEMEEV